MNIANVCERFAVLADVDSDALEHWTPLVEDACAFVQSRCVVSAPDEAQRRRLEALSAAYAAYLYSLSGDGAVSQFTAGDVKLTSSASGAEKAERLWRVLAENNADLVRVGGFLFGRVM